MDKQDERKLLNTLKSIDGTLKRIEQSLTAGKQEEYIYNAVSHTMLGEKHKDDSPMRGKEIIPSGKMTEYP